MFDSAVLMKVLMFAQAILVPLLGVIVWMTRKLYSASEKRFDEHDKRIGRNENDLETLGREVKDVQQEAVMKEDWLREMGVTRQKMDAIITRLDRNEGAQEAMVTIGSAIAAAINRSTEHREEPS